MFPILEILKSTLDQTNTQDRQKAAVQERHLLLMGRRDCFKRWDSRKAVRKRKMVLGT